MHHSAVGVVAIDAGFEAVAFTGGKALIDRRDKITGRMAALIWRQ